METFKCKTCKASFSEDFYYSDVKQCVGCANSEAVAELEQEPGFLFNGLTYDNDEELIEGAVYSDVEERQTTGELAYSVELEERQTSGDEITIFSTSKDIISDLELEELCEKLSKSNKNTEFKFEKDGFCFTFIAFYCGWNHFYNCKYKGQWIDCLYGEYFKSFDILRSRLDETLKTSFKGIPKYREQLLSMYDAQISQRLNDVKGSFIEIGALFSKMKKQNLCNDLYAYADEKYGFKSSSVKNMISIYERFCNTKLEPPQLLVAYRDYSYSQLTEMLSMDLTKSLPASTATIKEIRELKAKEKVQPVKKLPTAAIKVETEIITAEEYVETLAVKSFKNDKERLAFLQAYDEWALWIEVPQLHLKIYRVTLSDESIILAFAYKYLHFDSESELVAYRIYNKDELIAFSSFYNSSSELVNIFRTKQLSALI